MTDLKDALQPLLDQPPAEPEPLAALEARTRRRRRRRRISLTTAIASTAAAIAVAVGTVWPSGDGTSQIDTVGPTEPASPSVTDPADPDEEEGSLPEVPPDAVIVHEGETDGVPWWLQAYEGNDGVVCVEFLGGGSGGCLDPAGDGVLSVTVGSGLDPGTGRYELDYVLGPVRPDVARLEIRLTSGQVLETTPVGQDGGFGVNFFAVRPAIEVAERVSVEVIAYNADGEELGRQGPVEVSSGPPELEPLQPGPPG